MSRGLYALSRPILADDKAKRAIYHPSTPNSQDVSASIPLMLPLSGATRYVVRPLHLCWLLEPR
jgi:hypothetical protein